MANIVTTLDISVILPTYNESQNILEMLKSIEKNLPKELAAIPAVKPGSRELK